MIGGAFLKAYALRKAQEPTTWAGIVTFAASAIGWNVTPELRDQIVAVVLPIVSLCLVLANERHGASSSAPQAPPDAAPPAAPATATPPPHAAGPTAAPAIPRSDLPPSQRGNDVVTPHPVRPGFDRFDR